MQITYDISNGAILEKSYAPSKESAVSIDTDEPESQLQPQLQSQLRLQEVTETTNVEEFSIYASGITAKELLEKID